MITLTVMPLMLALVVGLTVQATDIVAVNARGMGHEHTLPWRRRLNANYTSLRESVSRLGRLLSSPFALALCVLAIVLIAGHGHAAHAGVLLGVAGTTEPTLADVKKGIDESNRAFEEFKRTNDERIKQIETRGVVDPLITQKLEKLNEVIDASSKMNEAFIDLQAKVNRFGITGPEDEKTREQQQIELRSFNVMLKSFAASAGRPQPADLDMDGLKAYRAAFENYLRRGKENLTELEKRALVVGTDPQGGYLVLPDMSGRMVQRAFETSPMRRYASVQTISTDALEGTVDTDEATVGWVSEQGSRTTSTTPVVPTPWRIPVHEIYSQPPASQKMLEDSAIDVVAWLNRKVGDKIGRESNKQFVVGTGTGKPRGFASYATAATADTAGRAWGTFEHVATGSGGSFGTDPNGYNQLINLVHAMKDVYIPNAAFYMTRLTLGGTRQLRDGSGAGARYIFVPSAVAGMPDTLLGFPVRKMQDMANYTTASALGIAFGDMQETYQIVDRLGVSVLVDPYTNKPYVNFYTRARVGGDALNFDSMKFLKFA